MIKFHQTFEGKIYEAYHGAQGVKSLRQVAPKALVTPLPPGGALPASQGQGPRVAPAPGSRRVRVRQVSVKRRGMFGVPSYMFGVPS